MERPEVNPSRLRVIPQNVVAMLLQVVWAVKNIKKHKQAQQQHNNS
jgi:hypothetical protein